MTRQMKCKTVSRILWKVGRSIYGDIMDLPRAEIDVYAKALSNPVVQKDVEQFIPLVLAKAGYEKRHLKGEFYSSRPFLAIALRTFSDKEGFDILVNTLEDGLSIVRNGTPVMRLAQIT